MPLYFAYGSNMSTARLEARVGPVSFRAVATLQGHALRFNKRSKDGSGKANVVPVAGEGVLGVVFELTDRQLGKLDDFEGGYLRKRLATHVEKVTHAAWVYLAEDHAVDDSLLPTRDYLELLLDGARANGFPPHYLASLEATRTLS